MIKTTIVIKQLKSQEDDIQVETDLDFTTSIQVMMNKIPVAVLDFLYEPTRIISIDLTENEIEIEAVVI